MITRYPADVHQVIVVRALNDLHKGTEITTP
jgi:hypothetical protein